MGSKKRKKDVNRKIISVEKQKWAIFFYDGIAFQVFTRVSEGNKNKIFI